MDKEIFLTRAQRILTLLCPITNPETKLEIDVISWEQRPASNQARFGNTEISGIPTFIVETLCS